MAAGLGFKDFTTGEVLTAADVDGYLMQGVWVFASAAARDAAVTSPQEGNFAYLKDTNTTTYYTGSAWTNLDTTGMVNPMTTTGDTIYSSSGSTPARLGIGSTGQVLTVSGGLPSWATPASGGGMTLISETVASAISSLSFSSLGSYKQLILYWGGIRHSTTGSAFGIRFNNSSSSIYIGQGLGMSASSSAAQGDQQTELQVATTIGAAYPFGEATNLAAQYTDASGYLQLENYTSTTKAKNYLVSYGYYNNTSSKYISREFTGYFDSTSAITSIDIFRTAGSATFSNQSNSTIRLYGVS